MLASILPIIGSLIAAIVISPAATICFVFIFKNYYHILNTKQEERSLEI
jgi:hypothetical protein